jgi:hypothetical protein
MDNFNLKKFLVENKLTYNSRLLAEAVEVPEWLKGKLADVHGKPGQGSIFAKPIDAVMKTVQQVVDGAKNVDQVANSTGTLTVSSPGIGYNLVLPMAQALKLPGAKQGEVEKVEGPNKVKVPSVTTTAPLSQFASDELTVIVRPKKDEAGTVIPNEYIVLSAFPGDPDIPRASEWGGKFAVIIPGGEQAVDESIFDRVKNAVGMQAKLDNPNSLKKGSVSLDKLNPEQTKVKNFMFMYLNTQNTFYKKTNKDPRSTDDQLKFQVTQLLDNGIVVKVTPAFDNRSFSQGDKQDVISAGQKAGIKVEYKSETKQVEGPPSGYSQEPEVKTIETPILTMTTIGSEK